MFNVMMSDFPLPEDAGELSLFADDIEFHVTTEAKEEAEPIIQEYLDKIEEWAIAGRLHTHTYYILPKSAGIGENPTFVRRSRISSLNRENFAD